MVFGEVNIDMIAGPSEIGILADERCKGKLYSNRFTISSRA